MSSGVSAVVYVDAGYLVAAAASRVAGTALRASVKVDFAGLVTGVITAAEHDSGSRVLRLYWYDGAKGGQPTDEQRMIGLLPRTKIRIGRVGYSGEQKGVDLRLGLDMVGNAQRRVADIAYLVSGDDDLAEAVEDAQQFGTQVVLLGVPSEHWLGVASTAQNLALTADRIQPLPADLIDRTVIRVVAPGRAQPVLSGSVSGPPRSDSAAPKPSPIPRPAPRPTPTPALGAAVSAPVSSGSVPVYSSRSGAVGTTVNDYPVEPEPEEITAIATKFVAAWRLSATPQQAASIEVSRPQIPPEVDRVLLLDASSGLGIADLSTDSRYALRDAFWTAYDRFTS